MMKVCIIIDTRATVLIIKRPDDGIDSSSTFTPGGIEICEAVVEYLKTTHNFFISRLSAERAIFEVGVAIPNEQDKSIELVGRDLTTGLPQKRKISTRMIQEPIDQILDRIVVQVTGRIRRMVSALSYKLTFDNEIILSGEYSRLSGLDDLFEEKIRIEAMPEATLVIK
jgi:rod shape-determining protein MreB